MSALAFQPLPRNSFFSGVLGTKYGVWGGFTSGGGYSHISTISLCNFLTRSWEEEKAKGNPPPGYYGGASATIGPTLYTYGGKGLDGDDTGSLFELNSIAFQWKKLAGPEPDGPMRKSGCAMAAVSGYCLVLFGGLVTGNLQPGPRMVNGHTNEMHMYGIPNGECLVKMGFKLFFYSFSNSLDTLCPKIIQLCLEVDWFRHF